MQIGGVENRTHLSRVLTEVTAVDAHAFDRQPFRSQLACESHDFAGSTFGIVGVDEQDGILRLGADEAFERRGLVVVRLNVGMGHRPEHRNAEPPRRFDRRRPVKPAT